MELSREQLNDLIEQAEKVVLFLGVVPVNPDWPRLVNSWLKKFQSSVNFKVFVFSESSNTLFAKALTSDSEYAKRRVSFRELEFVRNRATNELPELLKEKGISTSENGTGGIFLRVTHLPIPMPVLQIDDAVYVANWLNEIPETFEMLTEKDSKYDSVKRYVNAYCDSVTGGRFAAKADAELLELFDHNRVPRGIYPRSSFYDTDFSQLVIWGLVFDRQGRILIHRRADNAKDNRSMWDKSVGGHVDFTIDVDTSRAMARELLEELFTDELRQGDKGNIKAWTVTDEDVVYLGEWRPDRRGFAPMKEVKRFDKEWAFFRLRDSQQVYSPRTMPDGKVRRLRVISDVYLFIAGPGLDEESLGDLENSMFKLLELSTLKSVMDRAVRGDKVPGFDIKLKIPKFSPDLINIMTGKLRDTLEEFSQYIKTYL